MPVLWALKLFPWELNSPHWVWFRTWTWPCWIFPCMAAFLSTMTSSSNESKLSLLCLPHTLARDVWFLLGLAFAFFTAVITKTWILFSLVSVVGKLLDGWKYISSVTALTRHPLSLLLQVMSSTCPMTMWKHVRRYLGNWRTITWCLLHWFRSTGAGPGLCAALPSLPSSWTEVMVSKHFLYLSLEPKKSPSWLSAGSNLIVPTEKQTLALYLRLHFGHDKMVKSWCFKSMIMFIWQ